MKLAIITYGLICFFVGTVFGMYVEFSDAQQTGEVGVSASVVREPVIPTLHNETMKIRWVTDPTEVRAVIDAYNEQNPTRNMAMAVSLVVNDACVIYSFEPQEVNDWDVTTLGHEALHCFRGAYHK